MTRNVPVELPTHLYSPSVRPTQRPQSDLTLPCEQEGEVWHIPTWHWWKPARSKLAKVGTLQSMVVQPRGSRRYKRSRNQEKIDFVSIHHRSNFEHTSATTCFPSEYAPGMVQQSTKSTQDGETRQGLMPQAKNHMGFILNGIYAPINRYLPPMKRLSGGEGVGQSENNP